MVSAQSELLELLYSTASTFWRTILRSLDQSMDQWWASQIEMPLSQKTNSPCGWSDVGGHPVSKEQFSGQESRYHLALVVVVVTEVGGCVGHVQMGSNQSKKWPRLWQWGIRHLTTTLDRAGLGQGKLYCRSELKYRQGAKGVAQRGWVESRNKSTSLVLFGQFKRKWPKAPYRNKALPSGGRGIGKWCNRKGMYWSLILCVTNHLSSILLLLTNIYFECKIFTLIKKDCGWEMRF